MQHVMTSQVDHLGVTLPGQESCAEREPLRRRKSVRKDRTRRLRLLSGQSPVLGSNRGPELCEGDQGLQGLRS